MSVSINIVTRNRQAMLKLAIKSILSQTVLPLEIIVVDNASTDQSVCMLKHDFPEVHLIQMHRNVGCQPGRNIGMANCNGEIIFNMDDDGTLAPNAIEQVVEAFKTHSEVGLVAALVRVPEDKATEYGNFNKESKERYTASFIGAAHALQSKILKNTGFFPEYIRGHSEVDLGLRIINSGWEMLLDPRVVMYHSISELERDDNIHTYFHIWHQLETSARLQPMLIAFCQIHWRLVLGLCIAIRKGRLWGYIRGVSRFLVDLPRIMNQRRPISKMASKKCLYLSHHIVTNLAEMPNFQTVNFLDAMGWHLSRLIKGKRS